jgi:hypothetical protein
MEGSNGKVRLLTQRSWASTPGFRGAKTTGGL